MSETISKTNGELNRTLEAINALGVMTDATKGVYALAKNQIKIEDALKPYVEARKKLWKELIGDEPDIQPDDPRRPGFLMEHGKLETIPVEITPHMFTVKDLNLDKNPVRPAVLAGIMWLIKEES